MGKRYRAPPVIGIETQPTWNSDASRSSADVVDVVPGVTGEQLLHEHHHALEARDVRADAHVHAVAEPEVTLHRRWTSKRSGSSNSRSSRFAQMSTSTTRCPARIGDPRDLGVDEQRAAHELQRQLVAEHLLERVGTAGAGSATSAARWSG